MRKHGVCKAYASAQPGNSQWWKNLDWTAPGLAEHTKPWPRLLCFVP